ncbi:hypothetical protein ACQP25_33520 [Microtetraspora malaysiensis]|uniref:hypothetical protein n=1 Tax=Microtetraspora malaysiensis TaxID=161358 RepID=UPI003D945BE8
MAVRVVLWDIDHTLVDMRGICRELSGQAFERVIGVPMRQQAKIDGITESVIFRETAKLHGLTTDRNDWRAGSPWCARRGWSAMTPPFPVSCLSGVVALHSGPDGQK